MKEIDPDGVAEEWICKRRLRPPPGATVVNIVYRGCRYAWTPGCPAIKPPAFSVVMIELAELINRIQGV